MVVAHDAVYHPLRSRVRAFVRTCTCVRVCQKHYNEKIIREVITPGKTIS